MELMERARADGSGLVGPGGLLAELTKRVLEAGPPELRARLVRVANELLELDG